MALSTLGFLIITSIPVVIGVAEAIDGQKRQNQEAKDRVKFRLTTRFSADGVALPEQAMAVFKDKKLCLNHPSHPVSGYPFNGYYFGWPAEEGVQGMVSQVSEDPPLLNWIFADKETGLIRHGSRTEAEAHVVGTWSWTEDEEWLTLGGGQKFVAVENRDGLWTAHFDRNGDLDDTLDARQVLDIQLHRELQLGVSSKYVRADGTAA
ncbi:hypothetical protein MN608_07415 [Microdochium nivale]|nr:hypothetical protein MN608_07415 [Microdochium nivale]